MKIKVIDFGYEKLPLRAHENDAGADVYVCLHDCDNIVISPNTTVKIPLGFGLVLPDGYMACVYPRSGLSTLGIVCELPPIDSGYRGEIHAIVTNCSNKPYIVSEGDRIGQLVITPVVIADFITEDIKERGTNGFGSTGVNELYKDWHQGKDGF
jgi:dUTP pyrophosphatase